MTRDETTRKESSLQAVNSSSSWHRLRAPPAPGGMLDGWAMDGRLWMLWKLPSATPQRSIAFALWPLCRAMVQWSLLASTLLASCQDGLPVAHWIWLPDSNPLVARQPGCLLARWLEWGLPLAPQGTASTLG